MSLDRVLQDSYLDQYSKHLPLAAFATNLFRVGTTPDSENLNHTNSSSAWAPLGELAAPN